jgi:hypothetical protein
VVSFPLGLAAAAAGPILLWMGWRHGRVSKPWRSIKGWAALALAFAILTWYAGAWGAAVGAMTAMLAAFVILSGVAMASPPDHGRPLREPAPVQEAWIGWRDLGRRIAIFLIVVPGAFLVSSLVALTVQAAARHAGWQDANSTTFGLFTFPLVWTIVATLLMLRSSPRAMAGRLAIVAVSSGAALWLLV